jgi:hypothetical protein
MVLLGRESDIPACLCCPLPLSLPHSSILAAGRSGLAWALAALGITPERRWLGSLLAAAFADGLASDRVRCASFLFCIASLDFEYLVEWLGEFLEGKHGTDGAREQPGGILAGEKGGSAGQASGAPAGATGGLDLSLQKYAALASVLGALNEMDSRQLRAAWLDQTLTPEW